MSKPILNRNPAHPGKYQITWAEAVIRTATVELSPEDCDGADDLESAAISAIKNGGHPDQMASDIEDQTDFYVYAPS